MTAGKRFYFVYLVGFFLRFSTESGIEIYDFDLSFRVGENVEGW